MSPLHHRLGIAVLILSLFPSSGLGAQEIASPDGPDRGVIDAICFLEGDLLCLQGGRFRAQVEWTDFRGNRGVARSVKLTDESGYFWFFSPGNVELALKALDGRRINGHYWVFYGSLTNVEFTITVTDVLTGEERVYFNPAGRFASHGDVTAFVGETNCGGIAGVPCPGDAVCELRPGRCHFADDQGLCVPRPDACAEIFAPVCGCDGVTYSNDCERLRTGVAKDHDGPCAD